MLWYEEKTKHVVEELFPKQPSEGHLIIRDLATTSPFRASCVQSILASRIEAISNDNKEIVEDWWQDLCTLAENDIL